MPFFSIITVTYNNLGGLQKTCESLGAQTRRDFEWIVIDGGSVDGTVEYLSNFTPHNLRTPHPDLPPHGGGRREAPQALQEGGGFQYICEPDQGIYDAMNKGIERASGDYLLFLNAGDALAGPDVLEKIQNAAHEGNETDFIYGDAIEDGHLKKSKPHTTFIKGMFTHHQAMFFRREAIGGLRYDLKYKIAADYDFTCRFLMKNPNALYIPIPACVFESGGVSQQNPVTGRKEQSAIRKKLGLCGPLRNTLIETRQALAWFLRKKHPALFWRLKK